MLRRLGAFVIALVASAATADDVGAIRFPTSTPSEVAQAHFLRGAAFLHSFGYKQAIAAFQAAQAEDPDFAMAYWGESLCYNHPFLPEWDRQAPQAVLRRLGATPAERIAKAPTPREKGPDPGSSRERSRELLRPLGWSWDPPGIHSPTSAAPPNP
jgi:hypothetical protein